MRGALSLVLSCAMPAMAQDFSLDMPVNCTLGDSCYIQNYVDQDPTDGARDFQCGALTYDTHRGTDFALPSLLALEADVEILAAAPGTIRGVRDSMPDQLYTEENAAALEGRDCGNGVVIAHEDGWETQYCHLEQGSVIVQTGDVVEAGDVLGLMGLSGRTQFPHLHITVRKNGETVDPFDPTGLHSCGGPLPETLWSFPAETPSGGLVQAGFHTGVPDYAAVKAGTAEIESLSQNAPIVLWGFVFGARPGDRITMTAFGPEGEVFDTEAELERTQALAMRAGGLKAPAGGWRPGLYEGHVQHVRDGNVLGEARFTTLLR